MTSLSIYRQIWANPIPNSNTWVYYPYDHFVNVPSDITQSNTQFQYMGIPWVYHPFEKCCKLFSSGNRSDITWGKRVVVHWWMGENLTPNSRSYIPGPGGGVNFRQASAESSISHCTRQREHHYVDCQLEKHLRGQGWHDRSHMMCERFRGRLALQPYALLAVGNKHVFAGQRPPIYITFLHYVSSNVSSNRPRVNIAYLRAFHARASFVPARHLSQKICGRK